MNQIISKECSGKTNMNLLTIFILSLYVISIHCKHFRLGRSIGGNLGAPGGEYNIDELPAPQWFQQKLDHSSRADLRTWKQRYYVTKSFYNVDSPGPVFLMIGGEGPADAKWMVKGTWIDYAKSLGALCVMLEHRYYGESHPTSDMSVKNLAYLSSEQALADLANFITYINEHYVQPGSKWIVFGGSYPGALAAWMRYKYPHLVYGAVSSSGPVLAKVEFDRYFGVVVEALKEKSGSDDCVNQVKAGHKALQTYVTTTPDVVESEFRLCKPLSEAAPEDKQNFWNSIADDFAGVVQYNEDNRFSTNAKNITINTVCKLLTEPGSFTPFKRLAIFNSMILDSNNETCLDYSYSNMINTLRNVTWSDSGRQWMYQTCTEFGYYQTSSAAVDVFGNEFPLDFFIKQCQDIFGSKFNKEFINNAARWTNTIYGGLNITANRVVYVHGTVDPWHALGITKVDDNKQRDVEAILIKGTAHCANMYPAGPNDSAGLRAARKRIAQILQSWLRI